MISFHSCLYKQQIFSMAVASLQYCSTCFTTFRKDCFMLSHAKLSKYTFIFGWQYWLFHYKDKKNKIVCLIILYRAQKISSKSNTFISTMQVLTLSKIFFLWLDPFLPLEFCFSLLMIFFRIKTTCNIVNLKKKFKNAKWDFYFGEDR